MKETRRRRAKSLRKRGGRKLLDVANCSNLDKIKASPENCFKEHEEPVEEIADCSIILVDTKKMGNTLYNSDEILYLFDALLLKYTISLDNIFVFSDLKAVFACFEQLGDSDNFITKATSDARCVALNRKVNPKANYTDSRDKFDVFVHFLNRIKGNSEFLEGVTFQELKENIDAYFERFMITSLKNVITPNLIIAMYGHGETDKFALLDNGTKIITPTKLHNMLATEINPTGQVANLFIIPNQCFSASYYYDFLSIDEKFPDRSIQTNILIVQFNTNFLLLESVQTISHLLYTLGKEYKDLKDFTYNNIPIQELISEEAYSTGDFFNKNDTCFTSTAHTLAEHIDILKKVADMNLQTSKGILNKLRNLIFKRYIESENLFNGTPFYKKYYRHPVFLQELKEQLVSTSIKDEELFVQYFNRMV